MAIDNNSGFQSLQQIKAGINSNFSLAETVARLANNPTLEKNGVYLTTADINAVWEASMETSQGQLSRQYTPFNAFEPIPSSDQLKSVDDLEKKADERWKTSGVNYLKRDNVMDNVWDVLAVPLNIVTSTLITAGTFGQDLRTLNFGKNFNADNIAEAWDWTDDNHIDFGTAAMYFVGNAGPLGMAIAGAENLLMSETDKKKFNAFTTSWGVNAFNSNYNIFDEEQRAASEGANGLNIGTVFTQGLNFVGELVIDPINLIPFGKLGRLLAGSSKIVSGAGVASKSKGYTKAVNQVVDILEGGADNVAAAISNKNGLALQLQGVVKQGDKFAKDGKRQVSATYVRETVFKGAKGDEADRASFLMAKIANDSETEEEAIWLMTNALAAIEMGSTRALVNIANKYADNAVLIKALDDMNPNGSFVERISYRKAVFDPEDFADDPELYKQAQKYSKLLDNVRKQEFAENGIMRNLLGLSDQLVDDQIVSGAGFIRQYSAMDGRITGAIGRNIEGTRATFQAWKLGDLADGSIQYSLPTIGGRWYHIISRPARIAQQKVGLKNEFDISVGDFDRVASWALGADKVLRGALKKSGEYDEFISAYRSAITPAARKEVVEQFETKIIGRIAEKNNVTAVTAKGIAQELMNSRQKYRKQMKQRGYALENDGSMIIDERIAVNKSQSLPTQVEEDPKIVAWDWETLDTIIKNDASPVRKGIYDSVETTKDVLRFVQRNWSSLLLLKPNRSTRETIQNFPTALLSGALFEGWADGNIGKAFKNILENANLVGGKVSHSLKTISGYDASVKEIDKSIDSIDKDIESVDAGIADIMKRIQAILAKPLNEMTSDEIQLLNEVIDINNNSKLSHVANGGLPKRIVKGRLISSFDNTVDAEIYQSKFGTPLNLNEMNDVISLQIASGNGMMVQRKGPNGEWETLEPKVIDAELEKLYKKDTPFEKIKFDTDRYDSDFDLSFKDNLSKKDLEQAVFIKNTLTNKYADQKDLKKAYDLINNENNNINDLFNDIVPSKDVGEIVGIDEIILQHPNLPQEVILDAIINKGRSISDFMNISNESISKLLKLKKIDVDETVKSFPNLNKENLKKIKESLININNKIVDDKHIETLNRMLLNPNLDNKDAISIAKALFEHTNKYILIAPSLSVQNMIDIFRPTSWDSYISGLSSGESLLSIEILYNLSKVNKEIAESLAKKKDWNNAEVESFFNDPELVKIQQALSGDITVKPEKFNFSLKEEIDKQSELLKELTSTTSVPKTRRKKSLLENAELRLLDPNQLPKIEDFDVYGREINLSDWTQVQKAGLANALKIRTPKEFGNFMKNRKWEEPEVQKVIITWAEKNGYGKLNVADTSSPSGRTILAVPKYAAIGDNATDAAKAAYDDIYSKLEVDEITIDDIVAPRTRTGRTKAMAEARAGVSETITANSPAGLNELADPTQLVNRLTQLKATRKRLETIHRQLEVSARKVAKYRDISSKTAESSFGSAKFQVRDADGNLVDTEVRGLFEGPQGRVTAANITTGIGREARITPFGVKARKSNVTVGTIAPDDSRYFEGQANVINNHFRKKDGSIDAITALLLKGKSAAYITKWLKNTPEGQAYFRELAGLKHNGREINAFSAEEYIDSRVLTHNAIFFDKRIEDEFLKNNEISEQWLADNFGDYPDKPIIIGSLSDPVAYQNFTERAGAFIGSLQEILSDIPTRNFYAKPIAHTVYKRSMQARIQTFIDNNGRMPSPAEQKAMIKRAEKDALTETRKYVYNAGNSSNATEFLRWAMPFVTAQAFVAKSFAAGSFNNPAAAVWLVYSFNKALRSQQWVDDNGNPVDNPQDAVGLVFQIDERLAKSMENVPILGDYFKYGREIVVSKNSMDPIFAGNYIPIGDGELQIPNPFSPGFGPLVSMPVSELVKANFDSPFWNWVASGQKGSIWQGVLPFGASNVTGSLDMLEPGDLFEKFFNKREWLQLQAQVMAYENGRLSTGDRATPPTAEEIRDTTNRIYDMRFNTNFFTLVPFRQSIKTEFDVAKRLLYRYREAYGQREGELRFMVEHPDLVYATESGSENKFDVDYTVNQVKQLRDNEELVNEIAVYGDAGIDMLQFLFDPDENYEFSQPAYAWLTSKGYVAPASAEEIRQRVLAKYGWASFRRGMDQLDSLAVKKGTTIEQDDELKAMRRALIKKIENNTQYGAAWAKEYRSIDPSRRETFIQAFDDAMRNKKWASANADRPDIRAISAFFDLRTKVKNTLMAKYFSGQPYTLNDNPTTKQFYEASIANLKKENIIFADFYNRYFEGDRVIS